MHRTLSCVSESPRVQTRALCASGRCAHAAHTLGIGLFQHAATDQRAQRAAGMEPGAPLDHASRGAGDGDALARRYARSTSAQLRQCSRRESFAVALSSRTRVESGIEGADLHDTRLVDDDCDGAESNRGNGDYLQLMLISWAVPSGSLCWPSCSPPPTPSPLRGGRSLRSGSQLQSMPAQSCSRWRLSL